MKTVTKEQFSQQYGQETLGKFQTINEVRQQPQKRGFVADVGIGAAKGLGDTLYGTANLITEGGRYLQAAVDPTRTVTDYQQKAEQDAETGPWWASPFAGKTQEKVESTLEAKNAAQMTGKVLEFGAEVLTPAAWLKGFSIAGKGKKPLEVAEEVIDPAVLSKGKEVIDTIADSKTVSGVTQKVKEVGERIPRFIGRVQEGVEEASIRSQKIKTATPEVANAIKVGLPDKFINTVEQADEPTIRAYKEILDIADNPSATIKPTQRPEIIAGNAAAEQYKVIEKTRKDIGKQIGAVVDTISKKGAVDVLPEQRIMRDVLRQNGVMPDSSGVLKFTGKFTPAERTKIQQLYELATEGGEQLTPKQVYDMDRLFSKLQREARFENVGDIIVDTPDGSMSLFRVFRDVYSNKLDDVAPEIRDLNKQYRNFVTLQDDIEKSIVKSGKFETTKGVDDAEFAQTNLRRLFSEANTSADYRAIYEEMDAVSRALGYDGARADDLAAFAYELRKLYPETTPRTGFEGGIMSGMSDLVGKVFKAGEPTAADQQKALREILEARLAQ